MVAAIRAIAEHVAPEIGKTALDERVLRAMAKVPRHEFVPVEVQTHAYLNRPIPIGFDKTISQPLMVAAIKAITEHMGAQIGKTALDPRVLRALAKVPRHEFVPIEVQSYAYLDRPIPIGFDKTISQPFMVAVMTDLLELKPDDVVLEIGTGLGYQSAVLGELASRVYSVEIIDELAQRAIRRLKQQGYTNVEVRIGNGYAGWPEHAPFDKVMVTAAPDLIPPPLINQLKAGGRMVIPVGLLGAQQLVVVEKDLNGRVITKEIMPVLFSALEGSDQPAFRAS